jgi:glycosyltransferase involved in cell wall biosynthesis
VNYSTNVSPAGVDFSLITITKNDLKGLKTTIGSLLAQSHESWALYIILGSSDDGSLEFCNTLVSTNNRIKLVKQTGSGIYQAMNEGIPFVEGRYLWFMNSGDTLYDSDTLRNVSGQMSAGAFDILLGGYELRNERHDRYSFQERYISPRRFSLNIRSGSHQSTVFRVNQSEEIRTFRTDLDIASDFDWVIRQIKKGGCYRTANILSTIEPGGISDSQIRQVIREKQWVRKDIFGAFSLDFFLGLLWSLGVLTKIFFRERFGTFFSQIRRRN